MERVNHLAVFVAAIVMFLLGWVWYTLIFAKMWMADVGVTSMTPSPVLFIEMFVLGWVLAYFAAIAIAKAPNPDMKAADGIAFGLFTGIGFFGVPLLLDYISEGRPFGLWAINTGFVTLSLMAIGAIITSWKKRAAVAA